MRKVEYLIIGQGLAGTLFAHELDKNNHDFLVIDPGGHNASKTAAGVVNPVVLKRFSPVWNGPEQIQTARETMAELSTLLSVKLDYPMDMLRIFHDENEKSAWQKKAKQPELSPLLNSEWAKNPSKSIIAEYGLGSVNLAGRVDIKTLLASYRTYLQSQDKLIPEFMDYEKLAQTETGFCYSDIIADNVIFCEGYGIKNNPFFNHLPLKGNKGEGLIVRIPSLKLESMIKSSVFLMPMPELGESVFFVGATYDWTNKDMEPTQAAKETLLEKLSYIISDEVEVLSHYAGIRPTVIDRRPLLGRHETYQNVYILNGLGTRGVMLGATMAKQLYYYIEQGIALDEAVNIKRFNTLNDGVYS